MGRPMKFKKDNTVVILPGHAWIPGQSSATIHESFIVEQANDGSFLIEERVTGARGKCHLAELNGSPTVGNMYISVNNQRGLPAERLGGIIKYVVLEDWTNTHYYGNQVQHVQFEAPLNPNNPIFGNSTMYINQLIGSLSVGSTPTVTAGGSGYTSGVHNITLPQPIRIDATPAEIEVTVNGSNVVTGISVLNSGSNYTTRDIDTLHNTNILSSISGTGAIIDFFSNECFVGNPLGAEIVDGGTNQVDGVNDFPGLETYYTLVVDTGGNNYVSVEAHVNRQAITQIHSTSYDNIVDYIINDGGTGFKKNDWLLGEASNDSYAGFISEINGSFVNDENNLGLQMNGNVSGSYDVDLLPPLNGTSTSDTAKIRINFNGTSVTSDIIILDPGANYRASMDVLTYWGGNSSPTDIASYITYQLAQQSVLTDTSDPVVITTFTATASNIAGQIFAFYSWEGDGYPSGGTHPIVQNPAQPSGAFNGLDEDITGLIAYTSGSSSIWARKILKHRLIGFDGGVYKWNNSEATPNTVIHQDSFFSTGEDLPGGWIDNDLD